MCMYFSAPCLHCRIQAGTSCVQATSKEAFEAEDALQRQLAKKLGIKGKKRKAAGPVDKDAAEELDAMFAGMIFKSLQATH